jgi:hypothetical protein
MEDVKEILGDSVLEVHESEKLLSIEIKAEQKKYKSYGLLSLEKEPWTKGAQASFGGKG